MSISKLTAPDKNINRAIQDIYKKLNEIINAVNQASVTEGTGNNREKIRLVKKANGNYSLELRFQDGWVESDSSETTGFKLKETGG